MPLDREVGQETILLDSVFSDALARHPDQTPDPTLCLEWARFKCLKIP